MLHGVPHLATPWVHKFVILRPRPADIRCSLVNNNVSSQTDVVDAFAINGDFGRNLNFNNNIEKWIKLNAGRYSSFTVSIVDQNMNDIQILDSNILINFIVRTKK